jgi:uncharacterized protein (TIGR02147 family)
MSVYNHDSYRNALVYAIDRARARRPTLTQTRLAEKSGIHNTFISNVLKGRSDFNVDQVFALGEVLELAEPETNYISLLLDYEKATHRERKERLREMVREVRAREMSLSTQLELKEPDSSSAQEIEYYLNPYYMIVHTALHLPAYSESLETLAAHLRIGLDYLRDIVRRLEEMQFVDYDAKKKAYVVRIGSRHLPKDSPLCMPHQTMMRNHSLRLLSELDSSRRNHFSATFLGGEELRAKIADEFYKFTKRVKKIADDCEDQTGVYHLSFDLFPWT